MVATAVHLVRPTGAVGDLSYLAGLAVATVVAWAGVSRCPAAERETWAKVALGIALSALADLLYLAYGWVGNYPDISVADALWFASYLALGAGLVGLGSDRSGRRTIDVDAIIDSLVPAIIALLVMWELVLSDLVTDPSTTPLARAVWATYPVLDVMLLALMVRVAITHRRTRSPASLLLVAGALSWLAADSASLIVAESFSRWLDAGWMLASFLLAGAVLFRSYGSEQDTPSVDAAPPRLHRGRMWWVMVPLLVPSLFEVHGHLYGDDANPIALGLATAALVTLAAIRGRRLLSAAEAARARLESSERHFRTLAANSADAVIVLDRNGLVLEGAGNLRSLLGQDEAGMTGTHVVDALMATEAAVIRSFIDTVAATPGVVVEREIQVRQGDGPDGWLAARVVNLLEDSAVAGIVVNLQDITERRRAQDELTHQAFHDSLTGLANRALFSDRIDQALRRSARTGAGPVVLVVNVDGFKSVNDRYGHEAGNSLLREMASRLQRTVRTADTVGRLGGDEFAILIEENHHHTDEGLTAAGRALQAMSIPMEIDERLIAVSVSIGLALGDEASTASTLLRCAGIAVDRAKAEGKARIVVYDAEMGSQVVEAIQLEADLTGALVGGQFELHYQPVVRLSDLRLVGFEALLRWRHPELGLLAPDRFIPLTEETGLIVPIGKWVLETASAMAARWNRSAANGHHLTMAVNLSARQLATDDVVEHARDALEQAGLDASDLVLEMTETALVLDPVAAARRLRALRRLGVRLAIDDFGTGYSSLSYLRQFPIDILKIDRSFVETITDSQEIPPIVRGLLHLGTTMGLEVVAEGIETEVQRDGLRSQGCEMGQGFLFSHPLPASEIEARFDLGHPTNRALRADTRLEASGPTPGTTRHRRD